MGLMAFSKISSWDCSMTANSSLFTVKSYLSEVLGEQLKFTVNQKDLSHRSYHKDCSVYSKAWQLKSHLSCTTGKEEDMNSHRAQPGRSQKLLLPKATVSTQFSNSEVHR